MPFQRGYGGGGSGAGNYGGNNRGYSSGSGSGVSPWQMGHGQPASGAKVDPLALMGTIMGAMMGGGSQGNVQQLAGLAMANAIGTGAGPDRGYHGDRDRRGERQVMGTHSVQVLVTTVILVLVSTMRLAQE